MATVLPITGLAFDPICQEHDADPAHPERPQRMDAVLAGIRAAVPVKRLQTFAPREATDDDLGACHAASYLAKVRHEIEAGYSSLTTGDTDVCPQSLRAARHAAGAVLAAADAVVAGTVRNAFCAVRPPGHHATGTRGMGFCIFNNVAVAARYVQRKHGIDRVLIADWDVHHGNGTQDIFYDDPSVFFFSAHQSPFYPGSGATHETGRGPGKGFTMNRPFSAGSGRQEIVGAFRNDLVPAMRRFKPDFVFTSAGFDSRLGDPLGNFTLTDADFAELTEITLAIADEYAEGRLISVLEGGYDLEGLAAAAGAHVRALTDHSAR